MFEEQLKAYVEKVVEEKARSIFRELTRSSPGTLCEVTVGKPLIGVTTAAAELGVCESTVRHYIKEGRLQRRGASHKIGLDPDEVQRLKRGEMREPDEEPADEWAARAMKTSKRKRDDEPTGP